MHLRLVFRIAGRLTVQLTERRHFDTTLFIRGLSQLLLVMLFSIAFPGNAIAQSTDRLQVKVGLGTFLSRDRGWNYAEPVEVLAAVTRRTGSVDLEAGASFSKSFGRFSKPAIDPAPPSQYRDGFRVHFGVRAPAAVEGAVSALIGTALVVNRTDDEMASTIAGVIGVGLNFGAAKRASLDLRYVGFAKSLGSSRGILPLTLGWRL